MNKFIKLSYIFLALLFLGLAFMGVVIPGVPSTPFVMVASFFALRGSKKLDNYIKSTKMYQTHVESFVKTKAMYLKTKISILAMATLMLMFPLYFSKSILFKSFILILIVVKYAYFIFGIKTLDENGEVI